MALTGNADINKYAINKFSKQFGENGSFRLVSVDEMKDENNNPKEGLFSHTDDFNTLTNATKKYPSIQEIEIKDKSHYDNLIEVTDKNKDIIPLFIKDEEGELTIISSHSKDIEVGGSKSLVYLGKPFDVEVIEAENNE